MELLHSHDFLKQYSAHVAPYSAMPESTMLGLKNILIYTPLSNLTIAFHELCFLVNFKVDKTVFPSITIKLLSNMQNFIN